MTKMHIIDKHKSLLNRLQTFKNRFSRREIRDILIAWISEAVAFGYVLLLILIGYAKANQHSLAAYAFYQLFSGNEITAFFYIFLASAVALGSAFITHELMHKFTAQKFRYHAEFKMWPLGLVLMFITASLGFVFAMPGATYFEPDPREQYLDPRGFTKRYGKISFAGPKINFVFGMSFLTIFYLIWLLLPSTGNAFLWYIGLLITGTGGFINFYLCAFNMLPFFVLDGQKVFHWDKVRWASLLAISGVISVLIYLGYIPLLAPLT